MALLEHEWLSHAKALPQGQTRRILHLRERRPNLIVGHEADRWWAYCQACKQGGVVQKTHVRLTGVQAPRRSSDLDWPRDATLLTRCDAVTQLRIFEFLLQRGIDPNMLPALAEYSEERKRLLLKIDGAWLGRDLTGNSPQKWVTYNSAVHVLPEPTHATLVLTEDTFSMIKVRWALRSQRLELDAGCTLGTRVHDKTMLPILGKYSRVLFFYDGDGPGETGAMHEAQRIRAFGLYSQVIPTPRGYDPKDLNVEDILNLLKEAAA